VMLLPAALSMLACASLALSQRRNWQIVTGEVADPAARKRARIVGWVAVGLAFAASVASDGVGFSALILPLLLAAAGFLVALLLGFCPQRLRRLARFYRRL